MQEFQWEPSQIRNGIVNEAKEANQQVEKESILEKIEADLYTEKVKTNKTPTREKLIEIINNGYGTVNADENSFISRQGNYEINFTDIVGWEDTYVENGLILHLDAINNTGEGDNKHSKTTNIWKDLSGKGNDATIYNLNNTNASGWTNNSLVFDGVDDWAQVDNIIKDKQNFTIEYVYNKKRAKSWEYLWGIRVNYFGMESGSTDNRYLYYNRELSGAYVIADLSEVKSELNSNTSNTISIDEIGVKKAYKDGIKKYEETGKTDIYKQGDKFGIGADSFGNYPTQMDYYSFRIYNRVLTDTEIQHNYNIDKRRFDL